MMVKKDNPLRVNTLAAEEAFVSQGIEKKTAAKIISALKEAFRKEEPPKIALVGLAGVGKTSTINALFNEGQPISHVRACTKEDVEIVADASIYSGMKGDIIVYDMPGVGERITADQKHYETYGRVIPQVDVVLWIFEAADRVMTPIQEALLYLKNTLGSDFVKKLVIGVNKADLMYPGETSWNPDFNIPSKEQQRGYEELISYIKEIVVEVLPEWDGNIEIYSATKRYRLEQLMTSLVAAMDDKRKWVLEKITAVASYVDMLPAEYREYILAAVNRTKD